LCLPEAPFFKASMNQTRWSSLSAAIVISALSLMPASQAKDIQVLSPRSTQNQPATESPLLEASLNTEEAGPKLTSSGPDAASTSQSTDQSPVKVGVVQSRFSREGEENLVARVVPHEYNQQSAATLYVRNIPVLTFLDRGGSPIYPDVAIRTSAAPPNSAQTVGQHTKSINSRKAASSSSNGLESQEHENDPSWQATRVAAMINELARQESDEEITARWDADRAGYIVTQGETEIAVVTPYSILPDTTENWEEDALQVTNRLRRLLHQDQPLRQLPSSRIPSYSQAVPVASRTSMNGWASWYGPGFHGAYSANGEVFNARAMTAAHLTLPFGTQVRVTNLDNGRSVVVRINDRGPYIGGRILDVSEAAASALGMINSGVAPVRVDVLQPQ
jgi:rare lipoprotein A